MKYVGRGLVLALIVFFTLAVPVLATTVPNPDTGPFIVSYNAYENTYVLGDTLILVEYNIPYAILPANPASVNFLLRYINASGAVLETVSPYSYQNLGYEYGAIALYFAPGAVGFTWGEASTLQLVGNPTVDWASGIPSTTQPMMSVNWVSSTLTAVGRAQVCSYVTNTLANDLENNWNVQLTSQNSSGQTILNSTFGQQYFSNIIPYFSLICSNILTLTGQQPVNPPSSTTYNTTPTSTYVANTATFTSGSTNVIGLGTTWTLGMVGQYIKSNQDGDWYRIAGFVSIVGLTIAVPYPLTTEIGVAYTIGTLPYQIALGQTWQNSIVGPDIIQASHSTGINTQEWLFGSFLIVSIFLFMFIASKVENPGAAFLVFIPAFVGGIKIGVVPMDLGVGICGGLFILSMYLLIHRRAAV